MAQAKKSTSKKAPAKKPAMKAVKPAAKTKKPAGTSTAKDQDMIKKVFLVGLGATVMTAEKVKKAVSDMVNDLVAKGHLPKKDAAKMISELQKKASAAVTSIKPAAKKPAAKKVVAKKPAAKKAAPKKAAAKKSTAKTTAAKTVKKVSKAKPAAKKPAAKKVVAKKPATKKPIATKKSAAPKAKAKK